MKKWIALLLALLLPAAACAEGTLVTANGVVESANVYEITAPYSGVLMPFDWQSGERVLKGYLLFSMDTIKVYAPVDGTVSAIFAENGDLADDVMNQYGMLASMEKKNEFIAQCSTSGAYNDDDNKIIHMGEIVYIEQTSDTENVGEGRVISVDGANYAVEITDGDFDDGDSVKIYRDEKMTSKSCIGSGKAQRSSYVPVYGAGRILRCAVEEGYKVKKGQLLFEMASQDADPRLEDAEMKAPADGALEIACISGQQTYKGMVLARIHDLTALNVVMQVDEMDLDLIAVGDNLSVEFDRYPGESFSGMVTEISSIGIPRQNAAYYAVTLAISARHELLPGMNATVQLSK
ncbi:MAG: efflux RND transporter periplasmic adaptor subunit [Clostridia bacterium]|nr:efflux RND transporter periplasmic adaptor subunit [Clostridia bacterium]